MLKSRKKHINQNKVIDMPIYFHVRANYITKLWRSSLQNKILVPSFTVYGWDPEGSTQWVHNHFPDNMADIFLISYLTKMVANLALKTKRVMMIDK